MGTNYYVRTPKCENACEHCTESKLIHIGKSSIGWKFLMRADDDWDKNASLTAWLNRIKKYPIENEYGEFQDPVEFLAFIMHKQNGRAHNVDHGMDITGPYYEMFKDNYYQDRGFDFSNGEFS